jgi:hypothetical protein
MAGTDEEFWAAVAQSRPPGEEAEIVARHRVTDQFKRAWEIIAPDLERQGECERRIVYAILLIRREVLAAKRSTRRTTAELKKDLKKRIKKLQAAEAAVEDERLADRLTDERERMEKELAMLNNTVAQKGKPRRSETKEAAVHQAHELLRRFGSKQPSLYRDGAWHNLAKVLFGNEDADLFDYLERHSPPQPWYEFGPDGSLIKIQDPPLWLLSTIVGERR